MWWKTLGVKSDADIETIKKAYSALIKEYRPEQYPEQFSQIRQAFEVARKQVTRKSKAVASKSNDAAESTDVTENKPISPVVTQAAADSIAPDVTEKPVRITLEPAQAPIQTYTSLANNDQPKEESIVSLLEQWKFSKYKNQQYIERILDHPYTHDFFELKQAGHEVFFWLIQNIKPASGLLATSINMPVKDLARLNSLFGWSLKERDLYAQYNEHDLSLVFFGIASGQSERMHRNPILMQRAEEKQKDKYAVFEKLVDWGRGLILVYLLVMTVAFVVISFNKGQHLLAVALFAVFFVMVDGLFYSFKYLKKAGILRPKMITRKTRMWALICKQIFFGIITSTVIIALETITLFMVYGVGKGLLRDREPVLLLVLLPLLYMTYKLNKAIFAYSKLRYFQLIKELEQIRIISKK